MILSNRTRPGIAARLAVVLGLAWTMTGCRSDAESAEGISRDAFVAVYFDLRMAAIEESDLEIVPEERDRILAEHGLTEESLLGFIDSHVDRPTYMDSLWIEIQSKIDSARAVRNSGVRND